MKNILTTEEIMRSNSPLDETNLYNPLLLVSKSKGSYIWFEGSPKPYIDLLMGYSSTNFGHANDSIMEFVCNAIQRFDNITSFNSREKVKLGQKLISFLPFPGSKLVYYPVGGTKAVDAALKLARAYTKKDIVISFEGDFHGFSYGGMSVTDSNYIDKKQFASDTNLTKQFKFPNKLKKNTDKEVDNILKDIEAYIKENNNVAGI